MRQIFQRDIFFNPETQLVMSVGRWLWNLCFWIILTSLLNSTTHNISACSLSINSEPIPWTSIGKYTNVFSTQDICLLHNLNLNHKLMMLYSSNWENELLTILTPCTLKIRFVRIHDFWHFAVLNGEISWYISKSGESRHMLWLLLNSKRWTFESSPHPGIIPFSITGAAVFTLSFKLVERHIFLIEIFFFSTILKFEIKECVISTMCSISKEYVKEANTWILKVWP